MSTPELAQRKSFILRRVDGADRPPLVEEIYVAWNLHTLGWPGSVGKARVQQYEVGNRWPSPGIAWESFQDDIATLIGDDSVVMCTNTDPADHPEYHLTQGHEGYEPFRYGQTPLVLRYLATPAGSLAWRTKLDQRRRRDEDAAAKRAARLDALRAEALILIQVKPRTDAAVIRALGGNRVEVRQVLLELAAAKQIVDVGRTLILGNTRWEAVRPDQKAPSGTATPGA